MEMKQLTIRQRECLLLRAMGFSYREIGEVLSLSPHTVKNHVWGARRVLLPGVSDLPGDKGGYRLCYVVGLLDAGMRPEEVKNRLSILLTGVSRDETAIGRAGAKT